MKKVIFLFVFIFSNLILIAEWKPGDPIFDERDGQSYKTIKIGNQVWMSENLNYGKQIPTTKAGYEMNDNGFVEKYCWDNDTANCCGTSGKMKRGGFYEWKEAMQFWNGQPSQPVGGVCPKGWHIPSNDEWNTLFNSQGGANCYINLVAGGKSGFDALMTGYRCTMTGSFRTAAMTTYTRTYFWSSNQTDIENAPIIELGLSSFQAFSFSKSVGLCIRCLLDEQGASVGEMGKELEFNISPNPSSENISISYATSELSNLSISIYNSMGVETNHFDSKELSGKSSIDFSSQDLPTGFYYCTLNIGINKITKSFVIVK